MGFSFLAIALGAAFAVQRDSETFDKADDDGAYTDANIAVALPGGSALAMLLQFNARRIVNDIPSKQGSSCCGLLVAHRTSIASGVLSLLLAAPLAGFSSYGFVSCSASACTAVKVFGIVQTLALISNFYALISTTCGQKHTYPPAPALAGRGGSMMPRVLMKGCLGTRKQRKIEPEQLHPGLFRSDTSVSEAGESGGGDADHRDANNNANVGEHKTVSGLQLDAKAAEEGGVLASTLKQLNERREYAAGVTSLICVLQFFVALATLSMNMYVDIEEQDGGRATSGMSMLRSILAPLTAFIVPLIGIVGTQTQSRELLVVFFVLQLMGLSTVTTFVFTTTSRFANFRLAVI